MMIADMPYALRHAIASAVRHGDIGKIEYLCRKRPELAGVIKLYALISLAVLEQIRKEAWI